MGVRDHVQRAFRRAGYVIQQWPPEGSLERELERLIAVRGVDTVLDVGAHVGLYGSRLREIGFNGRIVSFEPSQRPYDELAARIDAKWEAHRLALGDTTATAALHVYAAHEEFTSLHQPSAVGRSDWDLGDFTTTEAEVRRLDDLVQEFAVVPERTLVKIDTQGHDAAVIAGGEDTLSRAAGLQLELPVTRLYEGAASFEELFQMARDLGFVLLGLFPVHAHPRPLVPVEFDGLFARR